MRTQFGVYAKPVTQPGWYRNTPNSRRVTYWYKSQTSGEWVAGRSLPSIYMIPGYYTTAWARGEDVPIMPPGRTL